MGDCIRVRFAADSIISSLGFGSGENISAIISGQLGVALDESGEVSDGNIMVGRIEEERLKQFAVESGIENRSKAEQLIILVIKDILSQSGLNISDGNCAIIISTTKGEISSIEQGGESIPLWQTSANIADYFGLSSKDVSVISNACISGVSAIITAGRLIKDGCYESVVVVGIDLLSRFIISGFQSFRSLSENVCAPYDQRRSGLNLGEGCGAILLTGKAKGKHSCGIFDKGYLHSKREDENITIEEKPEIFLLGGGISNDANHISGPSKTGDGLHLAMEGAMREAGVTSTAIDAVNLHGTATSFNDEMESKAMRLTGLTNTPANSLKPYFGHTLGASGVIETIVTVYQIRQKIVFATPGYKENGVSEVLNISGEHRVSSEVNSILKTASGFGGCNGAVVISSDIELLNSQRTKGVDSSDTITFGNKSSCRIETEHNNLKIERRCLIENERVFLDGKDVFDSVSGDFHIFIREAFKYSGDENMKFYKMDNLCKLGYMAVLFLLKGIELDGQKTAIVLSNSHSSLDTDIKHQKNIEELGDNGASPAVFVYTLPNIVAGEICIKHEIKGENTFFVTKEFHPEMLERHMSSIEKYAGIKQFIYGWCEYTGNRYKADIRYGTIN